MIGSDIDEMRRAPRAQAGSDTIYPPSAHPLFKKYGKDFSYTDDREYLKEDEAYNTYPLHEAYMDYLAADSQYWPLATHDTA